MWGLSNTIKAFFKSNGSTRSLSDNVELILGKVWDECERKYRATHFNRQYLNRETLQNITKLVTNSLKQAFLQHYPIFMLKTTPEQREAFRNGIAQFIFNNKIELNKEKNNVEFLFPADEEATTFNCDEFQRIIHEHCPSVKDDSVRIANAPQLRQFDQHQKL